MRIGYKLYPLIPNIIKYIKNKVLNTFININLFIISFLNKQFLLILNSDIMFSLVLHKTLLNLQILCKFSERSIRIAVCQVSGSEIFQNRGVDGFIKILYNIINLD